MKLLLTVILTIASVFLVGLIILQAKGTGLGSSFGGSGEFYRSKRGVEKIILYATVALTVIFATLSLVLLALP